MPWYCVNWRCDDAKDKVEQEDSVCESCGENTVHKFDDHF